jgi:hypothetical protein
VIDKNYKEVILEEDENLNGESVLDDEFNLK